MKIDIPPVLFYGVGMLLILFGGLRSHQLGWQRRHRELPREPDGDGGDLDATPRTDPTARRHMVFGLLWVVMGIFLVVSTYLNTRR
jgi:hypothetical protein